MLVAVSSSTAETGKSKAVTVNCTEEDPAGMVTEDGKINEELEQESVKTRSLSRTVEMVRVHVVTPARSSVEGSAINSAVMVRSTQ